MRRIMLAMSLILAASCSEAPASKLDAIPVSRYILPAQEFIPTVMTHENRDEFKNSLRAARQSAWLTASRITAPFTFNVALSTSEAVTMTLPAWATWFGSDDIERMFSKLYEDAGRDFRRARRQFSPEQIAAVMAWNRTMVRQFPQWTNERIDQAIRNANTSEKQLGLIGLNRTLYSPGYVRHILSNYHKFAGCKARLPVVDENTEPESVENFTLCFGSEFPADAVAIKTNWQRVVAGTRVPAFDTSGNALTHLSEGGQWGQASTSADPDSSRITTMTTPTGQTFRLTAIHFMTKESRDWHWITMWWSMEPNLDFGEDRQGMSGSWNNYKMCSALDYDLTHGALDSLSSTPDLHRAMVSAARLTNGFTWCSNPFLEQGPHNLKTNCIGCHQHGGTLLTNEQILAKGFEDGQYALGLARRNFPADYAWSWNREPENLEGIISRLTEYFDIYDSEGP